MANEDKATGGKLTNEFCVELHAYAQQVFYVSFPCQMDGLPHLDLQKIMGAAREAYQSKYPNVTQALGFPINKKLVDFALAQAHESLQGDVKMLVPLLYPDPQYPQRPNFGALPGIPPAWGILWNQDRIREEMAAFLFIDVSHKVSSGHT
jgi:hypothetical protein